MERAVKIRKCNYIHDGMKKCSGCGKTFPITDFSKKAPYTKANGEVVQYYRHHCKPCASKYSYALATSTPEKAERHKATSRAYHKKNKEAIAAKAKLRYQKNRDRWNEYQNRRNAKPEFKAKQKVYNRARVAALPDFYVIHKIARQTGLSKEVIKENPLLIQLKKLEIKSKRYVKNSNYIEQKTI